MNPPADMTMWGLFISAFVVGFSGALMPGPVMAVTITHSTRIGAKAGPLIVLGHGMVELVVFAAIIAGVGPFLESNLISGLIAAVGSAILLWMAFSMLRSLPGLSLELEAQKGRSGKSTPVRDGVLLSLANPYFFIWWATVGLAFISKAISLGMGILGAFLFFLGHYIADISFYSLMSLMISRGRNWISDRIYRGVVLVCALAMLMFVAVFAVYAWEKFAA